MSRMKTDLIRHLVFFSTSSFLCFPIKYSVDDSPLLFCFNFLPHCLGDMERFLCLRW